MKISETLYAAADVIRKRGWCTDEPEDDRGRVCILGAIAFARHGDTARDADIPASIYRHYVQTVIDGNLIGTFNDEHCKHARDAIAVLEIAADIAAAEGK